MRRIFVLILAAMLCVGAFSSCAKKTDMSKVNAALEKAQAVYDDVFDTISQKGDDDDKRALSELDARLKELRSETERGAEDEVRVAEMIIEIGSIETEMSEIGDIVLEKTAVAATDEQLSTFKARLELINGKVSEIEKSAKAAGAEAVSMIVDIKIGLEEVADNFADDAEEAVTDLQLSRIGDTLDSIEKLISELEEHIKTKIGAGE
ncbi:MAG: hypothetical protein Q4C12_03305 [Clostridia bacterium]|nr:hypothetical protein [Clostridia bacterium]